MIAPIATSSSTPSGTMSTASARIGLTDKYLHYLDTISNLKENTAYLIERTRDPSYFDLSQHELFSRQNWELQRIFTQSITRVEEDCQQLAKLTTPTPTQTYYQKNFEETIETMRDALREHTEVLRDFDRKIDSIKDKADSKSPSFPKKESMMRPSLETIRESSPTTSLRPSLVRQKSTWDISPIQSLSSTSLTQKPFTPPSLTHQTTDLISTHAQEADILQSLRRRDTEVSLLQNPIFMEQILRQGPPASSIPTTAPPPSSFSKRLWRATRKLFSFSKKRDWTALPKT